MALRPKVTSERPEDGNCFCCSPECCCSDPHEEASFPGSSWRHGSSHFTMVIGFSYSTRVLSHRRSLIHSQCAAGRRAQDDDDEAKRAARAMSLVQVGELSAARQALEGASMAPRTMATLRTLSDPERRPPVPRERLSREVQQAEPAEQFELDPMGVVDLSAQGTSRCGSRTFGDDIRPRSSQCLRVRQIPSSSHGFVPCWQWDAFRTSFWSHQVGAFDSPQQAGRRSQRDRRGRHSAKAGGKDDGETILQEG